VKVGCIDDEEGDVPKSYIPDVEIFTRSRVPWEKEVEGAEQNWADFGSGAKPVEQRSDLITVKKVILVFHFMLLSRCSLRLQKTCC